MDILILILATWRISSFFGNNERGPYNIFGKIREFAGIGIDDLGHQYAENEIAEGLKCVWCNSVWFGVVLIIMSFILPKKLFRVLLLPLALSAGAIIVNEVILKE